MTDEVAKLREEERAAWRAWQAAIDRVRLAEERALKARRAATVPETTRGGCACEPKIVDGGLCLTCGGRAS